MPSDVLRRHGVFCGSMLPPLITSEGNSLRIEFSSDDSIHETGFAAVFFTGESRIFLHTHTPVSYTHLDVYKRQTNSYEDSRELKD